MLRCFEEHIASHLVRSRLGYELDMNNEQIEHTIDKYNTIYPGPNQWSSGQNYKMMFINYRHVERLTVMKYFFKVFVCVFICLLFVYVIAVKIKS